MWDMIVLIPDHCLSIFLSSQAAAKTFVEFPYTALFSDKNMHIGKTAAAAEFAR